MATKIEKTLLSGLNPRQIEAVCNTGGHTLVFAGAGSGKTRVLTTRIAFLVLETGTPPEDILAVTFTNKAAREMRERVEAVLPGGIGGIWLGTFHSICARILRADIEKLGEGYGSGFVIYDTGDQMGVIKRCLAAR
ncbi:MAG: UvrD-helicase domain-containing protein, partial [Candidatus Dadabacteria bacterium]|nr:UvrD-helicase domain-containing protein [Candidatus Dadabacteria bacterium]